MHNTLRRFRSIIACLLVLVLILGEFGRAADTSADTLHLDGTESAWAKPELEKAFLYGLTYPAVMSAFRRPITREEFCVVVVKLYEKLTNNLVEAGPSPFSDTANAEIVKAYSLGIVMGTGAGKFSPSLSITRQEIATMLYRALDKAVPPLKPPNNADFPFSDKGKVAAWAMTSMSFAYQNNIMKGTSATTIDPLSNTTREQAIALIKRTFEAFCPGSDVRAVLRMPSQAERQLTQEMRYLRTDWNGLLNAPVYDKRLTLYAATGSDKPASKPTDRLQIMSASVYSEADCGALIERSGSRLRYFAYKVSGVAPTKIVWQVSTVPFAGYPENWQNPPGLVASGEASGTAGEFAIDFSGVALKLDNVTGLKPMVLPVIPRVSAAKTQQTLYVRAVPVDGAGRCLGDPGEGLRVLYGDRLNAPSVSLASSLSAQVWTPQRDGAPGGSTEFPNKLLHLQEVSTSCVNGSQHWFQFREMDSSVTSVVVQVAAQPFAAGQAWDAPSGLMFSKAYSPLPIDLAAGFPNAIPVTFTQFAPSAEVLKAGDVITYYLRFVGLQGGSVPGVTSVVLSEPVTVKYYKEQTVNIYQQKTAVVPSYVPTVQVVHYEPVQWEDPEWAHYYTVYRYPRWNELNFSVTDGTNTLHPYAYYALADPTMTPSRYEKELLWKWLAPGSKLQVWDREQDKSFWEELWSGVVSFFKSIVEVVTKVVNWASTSFAKIKMGVVAFIAKNFPGIPDAWRGYLQSVLTILADSGLAALGIPPTLPNFDALANGGLDYLARQALSAAGVPADAVTDALVNEAKTAITKKLADATDTASPNPLDAPFLHPDPAKLYRPAYIDIKITNHYTDKASQPGFLNVDARWPWQETGVTVETWAWAQKPPGEQVAAGIAYTSHFFYGLKKGYTASTCYYLIYEPVRNVPIPSLQPGTSTSIRLYLKEYAGKPYPFAPQGEQVSWDDFSNLYWGNTGKAVFTVWTNGFNLPPISPATSLNTSTNTITTYVYDGGASAATFNVVPKVAWNP